MEEAEKEEKDMEEIQVNLNILHLLVFLLLLCDLLFPLVIILYIHVWFSKKYGGKKLLKKMIFLYLIVL